MNKVHYFIQGSAIFDYGSIAPSLYRFKNRNRCEYAAFYAKVIYERKKDWLRVISPDALIPVPIHKSKFSQRGYNQSELIAEELSKLTKIPVNTTIVERIKNTEALKNLSHNQRQKCLKKAFKVAKYDVKLRTIVIIDDIYTTGSTIDEVCKVILEVMNCNIYFLTVTIGRGV